MWTGSELIVYGKFLDRQRSLMSPDTRARGTALDAPVWTGDGVVQWLGPSGRSDDGTWFRPLP